MKKRLIFWGVVSLVFCVLIVGFIFRYKDNQKTSVIDYKNFKLKKILFDSGFEVEEGPFWGKDKSLHFRLSGGVEVVFSAEKDFGAQVATLQLVLQESKIKQRQRAIIDLRGNKPYVSFQDNSSN